MLFLYLFRYGDSPVIRCLLMALFLLLIWAILDIVFMVGSPPKIKGLKSLYGDGYPIVGNIFQAINNPASAFMKWSQQTGNDIFQIRLGIMRVVVVNSYEDCKVLSTKFSCSTNSRPISYIFHGVVSATQGFTVGSTPAGESFKKKKKSISMSLNQKSVESLSSTMDKESLNCIRQLISSNSELHCMPSCLCPRCNTNTKLSDINLMLYSQSYVLKLAILLGYGLDVDVYNEDRKLAQEIIEVESEIIKLRSLSSNLEDLIPILRYPPLSYFNKTSVASQYRERRDKYMHRLMRDHVSEKARGDPKTDASIVGKILNNDVGPSLSAAELQSICLTLISAGLDNTPLNFNHLMGHLSQPKGGNRWQKEAFKCISEQYDNNLVEAWNMVPYEMNCQFILALIHETLRYFTVLPLNLPRQTTKHIFYKGIFIPKDTTIFFNAYAANHDSRIFDNPMEFDPHRWMENGRFNSKLSHFSFGEGSRKCSGNILAIKEFYILLCRMIILFKIKPPTESKYLMELDPFKNNTCPSATVLTPRDFKVKLVKRQFRDCDKLYNMILNTKVYC